MDAHIPGTLRVVVRPHRNQTVIRPSGMGFFIFDQQQISQQFGHCVGFFVGQPFCAIKRYDVVGLHNHISRSFDGAVVSIGGGDFGIIHQLAHGGNCFARAIMNDVA